MVPGSSPGGRTKNMKVGSQEWFEGRAKQSLKKVREGVWDFSDSALAYSPAGMRAYALAQQEDGAKYKDGVTNKESEFLRSIAPEVIADLPQSFSYIDLGPGTEHKEKFFFDAVKEQNKTLTYIPVDVSGEALEVAKAFGTQEGFETNELYATFEELPNVLNEDGYRFVSLGLTFANYNLPKILKLLNEIIGKEGGAFIVLQLRDRIDIEEIRQTYCSPQLMTMWHGKLSLIGIQPEEIEISATDGVVIEGKIKSVNEETAKLGLQTGDIIKIHQSLRYRLEDFLAGVKEQFNHKVYDKGSEFVGILLEK